MQTDQLKEIIVIGAGVVGLTTAIKIQEKGGYRVTVVAETFPTDPRTIRYTSHWAGTHHVNQAFGDERWKAMDKETFEVMWRDSESEVGAAARCFRRHNHTEFHGDGVDPSPWLDHMPDYQKVPEDNLVPGSTAGYTFTTFTLNTPVYINWLLARFLAGGGTTKRMSLQHITQVLEGVDAPNPTVIVVCPGVGARFLGRIEDKNVYPIRGRAILLRMEGPSRVQMGHHEEILTRALALSADLAPPNICKARKPTTDDLRPLIGGIRLEVKWIDQGVQDKARIPVVYNYGHSGVGFQSSWGSASIALGLLESALEKGESQKEGYIDVSGN
ncbi:hypothetical protein HYDPIDRAFT_178061 [Hydnomerulius pinastri MD-312]|uniref:FAD dependent oxidoreductase domain-containing protein n=1 Tax=Hydnomerulius pinastri MD-312 TaxID=994086 RepID=A0A0C9W6Q6_9AGAM|nr:hypothetical protein HYDPIDRAFT_178061 [Hydnomerulius pinastri MD-312]